MTDQKRLAEDRVWDARRLRVATDAAGVALWSWRVDTDWIKMDDRAFALWGLEPKCEVMFEELSASIHPPDLEKVRAAFIAMKEVPEQHEFDFRILVDNEIRWVSARTRGDTDEIVTRMMYGVFMDVTARMRAEEGRETLVKEMRHRIKNLFSVTGAIVSMASKVTETKDELIKDLSRRLQCLAAAHNLLHPSSVRGQQEIMLDELLGALLEPYSGGQTDNVSIEAPKLVIDERCITSLSLIVHELATNSTKYGALSADDGQLSLICEELEEDVAIVWKETSSMAPEFASSMSGFGTEMTGRVVEQINGTIERNWTKNGLIVTLNISKQELGARPN